jgi:hypothetical protein
LFYMNTVLLLVPSTLPVIEKKGRTASLKCHFVSQKPCVSDPDSTESADPSPDSDPGRPKLSPKKGNEKKFHV